MANVQRGQERFQNKSDDLFLLVNHQVELKGAREYFWPGRPPLSARHCVSLLYLVLERQWMLSELIGGVDSKQ